jgi:hypothetical protein
MCTSGTNPGWSRPWIEVNKYRELVVLNATGLKLVGKLKFPEEIPVHSPRKLLECIGSADAQRQAAGLLK